MRKLEGALLLATFAVAVTTAFMVRGLAPAPSGPHQVEITMGEAKTGTFRKTVNGTEVTMDWEWDCTPAGWKKILADWAFICDNPPPEE